MQKIINSFTNEFYQGDRNILLYSLLGIVLSICLCKKSIRETSILVLKFSWACFVKPLIGKCTKSDGDQQLMLEKFYSSQANIYDKTREILLQGRKECLKLAISHLSKKKGIVWVDVGGGTGSNIDYMDKLYSVSDNFEAVYLVDLSPSLCEVAKKRFAAKNWKNVHVILGDATCFEILHNKADLITFSYSLSMIPTFNAAVDHAVELIDKTGIVACVDFGFQTGDTSLGRIDTLGGLGNRNISWLQRNFWRIWFEADKVFLEPSRRTYLEYKFGTIKSLNSFNKKLGKIPYYIWIGCDKSRSTSLLHRINCLATESPYLSPVGPQLSLASKSASLTPAAPPTTPPVPTEKLSKGHEAVLKNFHRNLPFPSIYYQREIWRVYYDELNPAYEQFRNEYIYAFTWEDPREDNKILKFNSDDTVLAITSAGDNILAYATLPNPPRRIHAVDLNPCQNHLLELKLAAFRSLSQDEVWSLFGEGKINDFNDLLLTKLSPHMSSNAFQYWADNGPKAFDIKGKGLYDTGSTRWALRLAKFVFALFGVSRDIEYLCDCKTMEQQIKVWKDKIKPSLFNPLVATLLVGNPVFLWKALGVPANQAAMMGTSVLRYVVSTLDPVIQRSLISEDNYFYYLTLKGKYSKVNCPDYLTDKGYAALSGKEENNPLSNIRIHTDTLLDVFARLRRNSLTIAILMDHMDWFDTNGIDAKKEISALKESLAPNGRVMVRSASKEPWYLKLFEEFGFECKPAAVREHKTSIDRTNMYASTWICTKIDPNAI